MLLFFWIYQKIWKKENFAVKYTLTYYIFVFTSVRKYFSLFQYFVPSHSIVWRNICHLFYVINIRKIFINMHRNLKKYIKSICLRKSNIIIFFPFQYTLTDVIERNATCLKNVSKENNQMQKIYSVLFLMQMRRNSQRKWRQRQSIYLTSGRTFN